MTQFHGSPITKRAFLGVLGGGAAGLVGLVAGLRGESARAAGQAALKVAPLDVDHDAWRPLVSSAAYGVLFEERTERPFSSTLNEEKRKGTYLCAACYLPLFESSVKFDSGTGWPSFFDVVPGHVGTKTDHKLLWPRTEYHCARCNGHQGHVFNDGPRPTGLRYCNNGLALRFVPSDETLPKLRSPGA